MAIGQVWLVSEKINDPSRLFSIPILSKKSSLRAMRDVLHGVCIHARFRTLERRKSVWVDFVMKWLKSLAGRFYS
jgi:hypothetical protein